MSTINVDSEVPYRKIKTLAVMRFDDKVIRDKAVKGYIIKTISNPDAGEMLAEIMTNELLNLRKYDILTRSGIRGKIKAEGVNEEELVNRRDYKGMGKMLDVDAVVIGKIHSFDLSTMAVYERGDVSFTAECIDTNNGKTLWSMEVKESAPYKDEVELASKVVKKAVEELQEKID